MKSIVIGSGFGGIAAALRLKAKNHNVILIEKHSDLGGRARVFKKNGFECPPPSRRSPKSIRNGGSSENFHYGCYHGSL